MGRGRTSNPPGGEGYRAYSAGRGGRAMSDLMGLTGGIGSLPGVRFPGLSRPGGGGAVWGSIYIQDCDRKKNQKCILNKCLESISSRRRRGGGGVLMSLVKFKKDLTF